jgi:hypothetical protein
MTKQTETDDAKTEKKNFFELLTEFFGWVEIVISVSLLSGMLGFLVYLLKQNTLTLVLGIAITASGFIFGIFYATKVWKTRGTVNFISRVPASPELDNLDPLE